MNRASSPQTDLMVLRTVYVDPHVDDLLRERADSLKTTKANLFRSYLLAGMRAVKTKRVMLGVSLASDQLLVLRTVHIDPAIDERLRIEAFALRTTRNDLYRQYVQIGIHIAADASREG